MKKILILEANPSQNLSLNDEISDLQSVIYGSGDRDNEFKIDIGLSVKSTQLQELMQRYEPNIVHFCGHGQGQDGLVFQDKNIDTDTISNLFSLCRKHLQCVVLNACYSEVQADEINKSIKYVIGMNQAIRDDAAIAFSIGFYRALGYEKSVADAFEWGKNAIQLALTDGSVNRDKVDEIKRTGIPIATGKAPKVKNIPEHLKPVLQVNSNIDDPGNYKEINYEELNEAFLDAFRTYDDLERMLKFKLNTRLSRIIPDTKPLNDVIFDLIDHFEAQGKLLELIRKAHQHNPGNPKLKDINDKF